MPTMCQMFGGDPVTQLILVCVSEDMSPYCSAHDERTMMQTMCPILVVTQWPLKKLIVLKIE